MVQCAYTDGGETKKIPLLARVNAEEGAQTVRILVARGLTDVTERTRHTVQRWLDMVDWRAVSVGKTTARLKQSVKWYLKRGAGQVRAGHSARTSRALEGPPGANTRATQRRGRAVVGHQRQPMSKKWFISKHESYPIRTTHRYAHTLA